jgi:hypothetical protein
VLTVIEGEGRPDDRLSPGDLPLGPWAGADLEVWAARTGTIWHGDPRCAGLRSKARRELHRQPADGQFDDLVRPERMHCYPPDRRGSHWQAADELIRFDATTYDAAASLRRGDLDLSVFAPLVLSRLASERTRAHAVADELGQGELSILWSRCRNRRRAVAAETEHELAGRLPVMLAAAWVATGRTPRQHQERYARFLHVAEQECGVRGIDASAGIRSYANERILPAWLDQVACGWAPRNVTEQAAADQAELARPWNPAQPAGFFARLHDAWTATGTAWARMLEGMALSRGDEVLALFPEYGPQLGWELGSALRRLLPRAEIRADEFSWVVARVPAAFALFLRERERGLTGLVLADERCHLFDVHRCGLFLRNLLTDLGCPELADHVREVEPEAGTIIFAGAQETELPVARLHRRLQGFATGLSQHGLTRERCLPALRAACSDEQLRSPRVPRRTAEMTAAGAASGRGAPRPRAGSAAPGPVP